MYSDRELGAVLRRSYLFINFLLLRGAIDLIIVGDFKNNFSNV